MALTVSYEVAVGTTTTTTVPCPAMIALAVRATETTVLGFVLQEAFKVFESLEFGIWEI